MRAKRRTQPPRPAMNRNGIPIGRITTEVAAGVIERLADAAVLTGATPPVSVQLSNPVSGRQTWHGSMSGSARATIASSREMSPTRSG